MSMFFFSFGFGNLLDCLIVSVGNQWEITAKVEEAWVDGFRLF